MENNLLFDVVPSGKLVTVTARLNGDVLAVDKFDIRKSDARKRFANLVCDHRLGIDRGVIDQELLRLGAEAAAAPPPAPMDAPDVDSAVIVRPERIILPEVSGLAVPSMTIIEGKPVGRWILYLRWSDGRRESRPLPSSLDLPDGRKLFIFPQPSDPTPNMVPGWAAASRRAWLDGVAAPDPVEVFKRICKAVEYFLDFPDGSGPGVATTLSMFVLLSYCYPVFDAVPYLYLGGPAGSGKSRCFEILSRLVFRPLSSSNMTGAALFRTHHDRGGVLLLDEAERLKQTNDPGTSEILSMLLAGYKKGGQATRLEPVGDNGFKTCSFDVYGPKAMACIAGLPPALSSRCIAITMFRAASTSEKPKRRIDAKPERWQALRDDLHILAIENGSTWLSLPGRIDVCPPMSGRNFELWQPLLSLAAWIESCGMAGLLKILQDYALTVIDAIKEDSVSDTDEIVLRLLAEKRANLETPQARDLLKAAQERETALFRQWSAKGIGNVLRRYGIRTKTLHGRLVYSGVSLQELATIQTTYGLTLGIDVNTMTLEG